MGNRRRKWESNQTQAHWLLGSGTRKRENCVRGVWFVLVREGSRTSPLSYITRRVVDTRSAISLKKCTRWRVDYRFIGGSDKHSTSCHGSAGAAAGAAAADRSDRCRHRVASPQGKTGEAERLSYERKRERREQVASCRPPRTARKSKGHRSNRTSPVDLFVARQRAGEVTWRGALERALPCPDKYPSLIEQEPRIRPRRHIKLVWTAPCNGSLTY